MYQFDIICFPCLDIEEPFTQATISQKVNMLQKLALIIRYVIKMIKFNYDKLVLIIDIGMFLDFD